jgi:carbon-monoxide dehydrogenase medium subunit
MKPARFRYVRAETLEAALAAKAEHGDDARFLAGGQSLVPAMNFRLAQPAVLVDLNAVPDLAGITSAGAGVRIAAMTRNRAVERSDLLVRSHPVVPEAMGWVAHPQIRNRGTLGGNLSHADPASEMPAVMVALDATLVAVSKRGERRIPARSFFRDVFTTDLATDELLAAIELPPLAPRTGTAFLEVAPRHGDYATAGVVAVVTLGADGRCTDARLAFCNAGETPMLAEKAASALRGQALTDTIARDVANAIQAEIAPRGNVHASAAYQRHLAGVLARRALVEAHRRAGGAA